MKSFFLIAAFSFLSNPATGQTVNPKFDRMLQSLLSHSVPEINCAALDTMANYVLLDAREQSEFEVSRIPGAKWVGYADFSTARVRELDRKTAVVVYCSVGYRSEKISEKLREAGFQKVYNLVGGIFDWFNRGRPVWNTTGPTDWIHAYDRQWGTWLTRGRKVYDD